ncbi:MAG: ABC transporter ATP-binding protein [Phycisphaerae bacterium]|nr:ABC transporter ATP-binding protein [Phycisphaerae bacterium]
MLECRELTFAYEEGTRVLRGLSARFPPGAVTAVIGPNGAGKSTLLRLLLGVRSPQGGEALLHGTRTDRIAAGRRATQIAYLSQRPTLAEDLSVRGVIRLGRFARPHETGLVGRVLHECGLVALADRPYASLSAGQQQRVSLARALAQLQGPDIAPETQCLLADEPCAAMDPAAVLETVAQFRAQARTGRAVVLVLHDLSIAARVADRALVLDARGEAVIESSVEDALAPGPLRRAFGVPFRILRDARGGETALTAVLPVERIGPRESGA